jgi:hypothetical protein
MSDPVLRPPHYTAGRFEVIEVLEDWVAHAPDAVAAGLQWSCLKYLGRLWLKSNALQDAMKARFYLDRLIQRLEAQEGSSHG